MMAIVRIAILLYLLFVAAALENHFETGSIHELHPHYSSPAPSPSPYAHEHSKLSIFCDIHCALSCRDKKPWERTRCIATCVALCTGESHSFSEVACFVDCAQSSTNNLRYDANMMDDRMSACTKQCKKD